MASSEPRMGSSEAVSPEAGMVISEPGKVSSEPWLVSSELWRESQMTLVLFAAAVSVPGKAWELLGDVALILGIAVAASEVLIVLIYCASRLCVKVTLPQLLLAASRQLELQLVPQKHLLATSAA